MDRIFQNPLFKKVDKINFSKYRGIILLSIAYKVLAKILYQRLLVCAE